MTKNMNRDELLLIESVREACERCGTTAGRTVYAIKKLQRLEQARLAKAKDDAQKPAETAGRSFKTPDGQRIQTRERGDVSLLARHQAEHFFLQLPFAYQYALVDRLACDFDADHVRYAEAPVRLNLDVQDLSDEAWEELSGGGTRHES